MTTRTDPEWTQELARALGEELRRLRRDHGWTRKDMIDRLSVDISLQTLASYEWGIRRMSVERLDQIAHALHSTAGEVLTRASARMLDDSTVAKVDLAQLAQLRVAELEPLHRWACAQLTHRTGNEPSTMTLSASALDALAAVCHMTTTELIRRLPPA